MDEIPEEEIDSILDWYDQALANGQVNFIILFFIIFIIFLS